MPEQADSRMSPNLVYVGDILDGGRVEAFEMELIDEDTNERREVIRLEGGELRSMAPAE